MLQDKPLHDKSRKDVIEFSEKLFTQLKQENQLDKYKVFRIYRDVRFSKNKTPYKNHFGISFHRTKPQYRGGYYLHLEPQNSFIATGFWKPEKDDLLRIRKEIEVDASEFRKILEDKNFQHYFGNTFKGDELKTAPRGFDKEHPDVDLLRKKGFIAIRNFKDDEVLSPNFSLEVDKSYKALRPFFNLFSDILTTNLNGESII